MPMTPLEHGLAEVVAEAYLWLDPKPSINSSVVSAYLGDAVRWVGVMNDARHGLSGADLFEEWLVERYRAALPGLRDTADYHYLRAEWERGL